MLSFLSAHSQPKGFPGQWGLCPHDSGCRRGPRVFQAGQEGNGICPFPWRLWCHYGTVKAPVTHLALQKGTLQDRGTWVGGWHCLLKTYPGRNSHHGPWPCSSGWHHPLPHQTQQKQSPAPPCPTPQTLQNAQLHAPLHKWGRGRSSLMSCPGPARTG